MSTSIESLPNGNHNKTNSNNSNQNTPGNTNSTKSNRTLTGVNQSYINNKSQIPEQSQLPRQSLSNIIKDIAPPDNEIHPLPSRDIPTHTLPIVNDAQVKPTYIKKEPTVDYIRNHDNIDTIKKKAVKEKNDKNINGYEQYLSYALVAILYTLLQLPIVKKMFRNYIPGIFMPEGIPYFSYHILLAIILSAAYFIVDKYVLTIYLNNMN
jgi:hypothetical protein